MGRLFMEDFKKARLELPSEFIWRRLHSLAGMWLSGYIILHLMTNSQAALFVGNDGKGFIHDVNAIQNLPYLPILEILILGVPILIHLIWGVKYIFTAKYNSFSKNAHEPYLPYGRNKAYTWQRWTAWILAVGLIAHIAHMRFIDHPVKSQMGSEALYMTKVNMDPGIKTLSNRLDIALYTPEQIQQAPLPDNQSLEGVERQTFEQKQTFEKNLKSFHLNDQQAVAVAKSFGAAELYMLRETFKSPWMMILYTFFVLAAAYHAFNGMWTFLITWGITPVSIQRGSLRFSQLIMLLVTFLGLATIWMTYWINLKS